MNRSRIRLLWLAAGVLACVVVAIGLVIWKIMPVAAIVDGWGTGVLFSVVWVGITQYYAVERPAERQLRNATVAVLVELSANYEALAFRNSVSVGGMVFDMFDQHGPTVMGALDVGAATALMGLYRGQRNLGIATRNRDHAADRSGGAADGCENRTRRPRVEGRPRRGTRGAVSGIGWAGIRKSTARAYGRLASPATIAGVRSVQRWSVPLARKRRDSWTQQ